MGKLDALIRRLGKANTWQVLEATAGAGGPMAGYADELLTLPRAADTLGGIDEFLTQHGVRIGAPIGRGRESMVFGLRSGDSDYGHVLKIQAPGAGRGFTLPTGVDGVAGYWATQRLGPGVQVALQERAARVLDPMARARFGGIAEESRWINMADAVQRSLAARGLEWSDPHAANVGIMRDGNMAAIDGAVFRGGEDALPISAEDAIRLLRAPVEVR